LVVNHEQTRTESGGVLGKKNNKLTRNERQETLLSKNGASGTGTAYVSVYTWTSVSRIGPIHPSQAWTQKTGSSP